MTTISLWFATIFYFCYFFWSIVGYTRLVGVKVNDELVVLVIVVLDMSISGDGFVGTTEGDGLIVTMEGDGATEGDRLVGVLGNDGLGTLILVVLYISTNGNDDGLLGVAEDDCGLLGVTEGDGLYVLILLVVSDVVFLEARTGLFLLLQNLKSSFH